MAVAGKPVEVLFATQSRPNEFREQGDERLINAYIEVLGEGQGATMRVRMSPGLTQFSAGANDFGCRSKILSGSYVYAVFQTGVYKVASNGARTHIGAISGTGPVSMALNAAGQIGIVTDLGRYYILENDIIDQINTSDIGEFNSICWIEGYFILTLPDGRFFNTGLNGGRSINGLDYATAEGSPDGLLGGFALGSELWLFGVETIEVWANTGASPGSPFTRQSSSWINKGCLSYWSVALVDNTLFWIGNDRLVFRAANYTPQRISHEGVERAITTAAENQIAAGIDPPIIRGGTYTIDGHAFYVISCSEFTWAYDIKEGRWHERKSKALERWRAETFLNAFGKWIVGTVDDGNLYVIDMTVRLEGANLMVVTMRSVPMGAYPNRAIVYSAEINFVTGRAAISGTVPQTQPFTELRYTDDGGAIWSHPRQLELGEQGEYGARCRTHRLGRTGAKWGRTWEITCSDPHILTMSKMVLRTAPLA